MNSICSVLIINRNATIILIENLTTKVPASENMLPKSEYCWISHIIMFFKKFLKQVPHFESFFHVVILFFKLKTMSLKRLEFHTNSKPKIFNRYLVHIYCLQAFSSCENNGMVLIFWLPFSQYCRSRKLYSINILHKNIQLNN